MSPYDECHYVTWRILVASDGSPPATAALALALKRFPDADITALHVIDPVGGYHRVLAGGRFEEWHTVAKQRADTILQQAADQAARDDRSIQVVCETGDTVESIIEYALEHEFDHIVIGNHGREGVDRFLFGNVAERVTRRAPMPVTVVKAQGTTSG